MVLDVSARLYTRIFELTLRKDRRIRQFIRGSARLVDGVKLLDGKYNSRNDHRSFVPLTIRYSKCDAVKNSKGERGVLPLRSLS